MKLSPLPRRVLALTVFLCACSGGIYLNDGSVPTTVPSISSFTARPASLDAGGGTTTLSWTVLYAGTVQLDAGGDVTGLTSKDVTLTETTAFTLTAYNAIGYTAKNLTVVVGP